MVTFNEYNEQKQNGAHDRK